MSTTPMGGQPPAARPGPAVPPAPGGQQPPAQPDPAVSSAPASAPPPTPGPRPGPVPSPAAPAGPGSANASTAQGQVSSAGNRAQAPAGDPVPWIFWGFFIVFVLPLVLLAWSRSAATKPVPVLIHAVLPYHVITESEVTLATVPAAAVTTDTIQSREGLVGHRTREALPADQPIHWTQVAAAPDPLAASAAYAAVVPISPTLALGHTISAGDLVTVAVAPNASGSFTGTRALSDTLVLVLDVKTVASDTVAVLAVPADRWIPFLQETHNATVMLGVAVTNPPPREVTPTATITPAPTTQTATPSLTP